MKTLFLLILSSIVCLSLNAQKSIIKGTVSSIPSGSPIFGALIMSDDSNVFTRTDFDGRFKLVIEDSISNYLNISLFPDYKDTLISYTPGKRSKMSIDLEPSPYRIIENHCCKECPKCGSEEHIIPVEYGLITAEKMQRQEEKKCVLLGCILQPYKWFCISCRLMY